MAPVNLIDVNGVGGGKLEFAEFFFNIIVAIKTRIGVFSVR